MEGYFNSLEEEVPVCSSYLAFYWSSSTDEVFFLARKEVKDQH
jgi:hypothetical protein